MKVIVLPLQLKKAWVNMIKNMKLLLIIMIILKQCFWFWVLKQYMDMKKLELFIKMMNVNLYLILHVLELRLLNWNAKLKVFLKNGLKYYNFNHILLQMVINMLYFGINSELIIKSFIIFPILNFLIYNKKSSKIQQLKILKS